MLKKYLNDNINKITKVDAVTVILIMLIYSILAFYKLGDTTSSQTFYNFRKDDEVIFELNQATDVIRTKFYTTRKAGEIQVLYSTDGESYQETEKMYPYYTFAWHDYRIAVKTKYIKFKILEDVSLGEVGFYDNNKEYIDILSVTSDNKEIKTLNDEKEQIPNKISYMNSSYFDEYYFARSAYEYANGLSSNEWTHPPLGKVIQMIPISITHKMTPFNYRLMGNISGILLVGVMYIFGLILFKKRKYAITASLLMFLDTFHFAQTRMGTVDSHLVLFITLAAMFMYLFVSKEKTRYLALSGLFFGLSISVKWTGFYGGIALAIIYFTYLIKNKKIKIE